MILLNDSLSEDKEGLNLNIKLTTREEIIYTCLTNPEAIADLLLFLIKENTELKQRVKVLEDQVNKNSRNSSKPPSSDGMKKPVPKSLRETGKKSVGGQDGHPGRTLRMVANPDYIIVHSVDTCPCGCNLKEVPILDMAKRQVFDLPPKRIVVTEHQAEIKRCFDCRTLVKASFPADVNSPVQYGQHLNALSVYLNQYQMLPLDRICDFMKDVFDLSLSEATLLSANANAYKQLAPAEKAIKEQIIASPVVHFDETGMYVNGIRQWCHTASTSKLTHYGVHVNRGKIAMIAMGILPFFRGTAVHDCYDSYWGFLLCLHALCNAHILRELIFVLEQEKQLWAKDMINLLLEAKKAVESKRQIGAIMDITQMADLICRYNRILEMGFAEDLLCHPIEPKLPGKRGKQKQSYPKNLLDRLKERQHEVLRFISDMNVPFDNNLVERDQRMNKVKQKVSGTFRSQAGANEFCRIRGYISTVRKYSLSVLDALYDALCGKPFIPN